MENLQLLAQIYNALLTIRVEGQGVLVLSECLIGIQQLIEKMQKEIQAQENVGERSDN